MQPICRNVSFAAHLQALRMTGMLGKADKQICAEHNAKAAPQRKQRIAVIASMGWPTA